MAAYQKTKKSILVGDVFHRVILLEDVCGLGTLF